MAAAVATKQQRKYQWGELADDDGASDLGLLLLLPPRVVVGPDAGGLRKVIEYRFDDEGNKVKVVTTTRTCSLARARLSRSAVERRSWAKFGDAVKGDDAGSRLTMVSTEEVLLERPRARGHAWLPVGVLWKEHVVAIITVASDALNDCYK
ncbi:eukaryotic translation initiation factor 3 subunit G-like [Miscanthus floridulus]|uniref:eukaryotic translation initiation factor 3 subunit G-like n=1 Tax=Miscanthus floridulus TaxID=154761 RepID=UPI00345A755A